MQHAESAQNPVLFLCQYHIVVWVTVSKEPLHLSFSSAILCK